MEIVQELPTVDYILAPVGGGGLITGVSTLAKMLNPKIKVIGVEPANAAASMTAAFNAGEPVTLGQCRYNCRRYCCKTCRRQYFPSMQRRISMRF